MLEIARRGVGHTAKNFPILLIGIGLVTTVLWVSTVVAVALDQIWSALSGLIVGSLIVSTQRKAFSQTT
jgi:hypothetical protein